MKIVIYGTYIAFDKILYNRNKKNENINEKIYIQSVFLQHQFVSKVLLC